MQLQIETTIDIKKWEYNLFSISLAIFKPHIAREIVHIVRCFNNKAPAQKQLRASPLPYLEKRQEHHI